METDKNYFLVGLFVIVIVVAGFIFTLWLTVAGTGPSVNYRIHFAEAVGGLRPGSMVKFHGVDVGTVQTMEIDPKDMNLTQVDISVLASTPVKADTTATLQFLGVSGDVYVELAGGTAAEPNLIKVAKEYPPEIRATKSNLTEVMDRLPRITEKADTLLEKLNHAADQVNKVFSDQNVHEIHSVIHGVSKFIGSDDSDKNSDSSE